MKNLDLISEELFNKIRGRFPSVTIGDAEGNVTNKPNDARFFDFDYKEGDTSLGKVSISVNEEAIEVMYSDNFVGEQDEITQQKWYDFLKELRQFSKKRLMKFDTRNINKSNLDRRDYQFLATNRGDNTMSESKMYGTNKLSYQNVDNARIIIKHTESVNPEAGITRTRNIGKIYIESADGERFLYPYKHLTGARAMARHVAEGGKPFDDFGTHIVGLSEEMNKLRKFKSYMGRSAVMAESLAGYMDVVKDRIGTVKKTIESLQKPKFYAETFASFEKPMMEDVPSDVAENWVDQLTIRQFNEELKDVFPYIYNLVSEATKAKDITAEDILGEAPIDDVEVRAPAETYKVASGDTIYSIAKKFQNANFQGADIEEAVKEIMMLNNIADPKSLQVGQVIEMPYFMGTGPDGSTRGMPGSFDKYGEEIENGFEDIMGQFAEAKEEMCPEACCGKPVTECKCGPDCEHCDCHEKNKMNEDETEGNAYAHAVKKAKMNGKKKGDKVDGPDGDEITLEKEQKLPISEFVLSLFDRENGTFPKGETAVLTAIEKDYGEQYIDPAKQFIEAITAKFEEFQMEASGPCHGCSGTGHEMGNPRKACPDCGGTGKSTEIMVGEEDYGTVMEPTIGQDEEMGEGFDDYVTVDGNSYENEADAIQTIMNKGASSAAEQSWLMGMARTHDFYGKPENIGPALQKIRNKVDKKDKDAGPNYEPVLDPGELDKGPSANFPSMEVAMSKVMYYEPGEQVNIAGQIHVRDVKDGKKIWRSVKQDNAEKKTEAQEIRELGDRLMKLAGL